MKNNFLSLSNNFDCLLVINLSGAIFDIKKIISEEVEYYAIYDPNIINVLASIALLELIEHLGRIAFAFFRFLWQKSKR